MKENKELKLKIQELEKKVKGIELKFQIGSHEVAIENYIVLEVLGSKKKMIKNSIYTINDLQKTVDYEKTVDYNSVVDKMIKILEDVANNGINLLEEDHL